MPDLVAKSQQYQTSGLNGLNNVYVYKANKVHVSVRQVSQKNYF
jgi:hypothetical protein